MELRAAIEGLKSLKRGLRRRSLHRLAICPAGHHVVDGRTGSAAAGAPPTTSRSRTRTSGASSRTRPRAMRSPGTGSRATPTIRSNIRVDELAVAAMKPFKQWPRMRRLIRRSLPDEARSARRNKTLSCDSNADFQRFLRRFSAPEICALAGASSTLSVFTTPFSTTME